MGARRVTKTKWHIIRLWKRFDLGRAMHSLELGASAVGKGLRRFFAMPRPVLAPLTTPTFIAGGCGSGLTEYSHMLAGQVLCDPERALIYVDGETDLNMGSSIAGLWAKKLAWSRPRRFVVDEMTASNASDWLYQRLPLENTIRDLDVLCVLGPTMMRQSEASLADSDAYMTELVTLLSNVRQRKISVFLNGIWVSGTYGEHHWMRALVDLAYANHIQLVVTAHDFTKCDGILDDRWTRVGLVQTCVRADANQPQVFEGLLDSINQGEGYVLTVGDERPSRFNFGNLYDRYRLGLEQMMIEKKIPVPQNQKPVLHLVA
jgi:hypothetical protein